MSSRCQAFRSIFWEREPKTVVSCSLAHEQKNVVNMEGMFPHPPSYSHGFTKISRWHRAFVDLIGSSFNVKTGLASSSSSPFKFIIDWRRVSGLIRTGGENP